LTLTRGGTNSTRFTLNPTSRIPSIPVGGTATFTVRSNTSLAVGTYTAIVTVSGGSNITAQSFNVSIAVKDGISLMREGLVSGVEPTSPFLTFSQLQRQQVARVEVIDLHIPNMNTFVAGTFNGKNIVAAVDLTHANSDYPVVAFSIASNISGQFDVFIAGHRGVVATSNMSSVFRALINATSMDLALLDTSRVTNMFAMFMDTYALTTLNVSGWDTSSVTTMQSMFIRARRLTSLDLSGFDTSKVTSLYAMFHEASSLTTLNLSGWNTSNVTNMQSVFSGAISLTSLNLSGWNTSKVTNMNWLFSNTQSLTNLDFRKATFGSVTENTSMFALSGINTITVGSTAAQTYIQNAPGWTDVAGRKIEIRP